MKSNRGITLTELLVASTVSFAVILGITQVDMTRLHLLDQIRQRSTGLSELGLALAHMARSLQRADRVYLPDRLDPTVVQFRTPLDPTAGLDTAADYQWAQYRLVGNEIRFYDGGCGVAQRFGRIGTLSVQYRNESVSPDDAAGFH
jgi:hypothetical protein